MSPITGLAVQPQSPSELPEIYPQNEQLAQDRNLRPEAILVRHALMKRGLETPMFETGYDDQQKQARIREHFVEILEILGLDLSDDSLCDTPRRIAKMYVNEIFSGLNYENFPKLTVIENKMQVDEMVKVQNIDLSSTCEHHFITIDGKASVAYIPNEKVIGLSKIKNALMNRYWWHCKRSWKRMTLPSASPQPTSALKRGA
jgi:hypothetical protein